MPETITIVPLENANPDDIRAIYRRSVLENTEGFIQDLDFHGDIIAQAEEMTAKGGRFFALQQGGIDVGFGGLKQQEEDGVVELCKLHVLSDYHGQGHGVRLSEHLIATARELGADSIELHVTVTQVPAISLYERLGFKKTKRQTYDVPVGDTTQSFDTQFMLLKLD